MPHILLVAAVHTFLNLKKWDVSSLRLYIHYTLFLPTELSLRKFGLVGLWIG